MMSEKRLRFTMESDKLYSCIFDNGNELTCFELVDLLNELYEENEQLKEELNNLKKDETRLYHYYTLARYGGDGV